MKIVLSMLACISMAFTSPPLRAQISRSDLNSAIDIEKLEHPYILFDANGKTQMLQDIQENEELKKIFDEQLSQAKQDLKQKVNHDLFLYVNSANPKNRKVVEVIESYTEIATRLAFMYQLTENKAYADKAYEFASVACSQDSWIHPSHEFDVIYPRVWPWNTKDDQVVFSYDLHSASTATELSLIYDWLYPVLEKNQRDRIRGALLEKAVLPVRGNYEYFWWAEAYRCNWSAICHSGVGIAGLTLLKEDPQLLDVVAEAYNGINNTFSEYGIDGGWSEGRGYWRKALLESSMFVNGLKNLSAGKYNLYNNSRIMSNPMDFPLYTMYANFGDGSKGPVGNTWFTHMMVNETQNSTAAYYLKRFMEPLNREATFWELIFQKPDVIPLEPETKSKHFRTIGWAVMQSDFTSDTSMSIACKAGSNEDPHHGHLDVGTFIVSYNDHNFICDPRRGRYGTAYFGAQRWEFTNANTRGHNVIRVNSEEQVSAKLKDEPWKKGVGGQITNFESTPAYDQVSMDLSPAYPGQELKSWKRQILLEKPKVALVVDKVEAEQGAEIQSRIHPDGNYKLADNYVIIEHEKKALAVFPFGTGPFELVSGKDPSFPESKDAVQEWIPYIDVLTKAKSDGDILGMVILALDENYQLGETIESLSFEPNSSGILQLSFTAGGKSYRYQFENDQIIPGP